MFVPKGDFGNEGKDSFSTNNFINDYQWQWEKMFRLDSRFRGNDNEIKGGLIPTHLNYILQQFVIKTKVN
jgi:hypothetical protein